MGVTVTDGRTSQRVLAAVLFVVTLVALLLLLPARASGASPSLVTATDNASGRYDTVVLRDLGKRTAAVVSMVAEGGAFTADQLWRSRKGKLDVRKVKWLAADVNADGFADGVALLDLGKGRSRFVIYRSNGDKAVPKTAWTSKKGAFSWARAKLAVGDVNGDSRDDVIALYDRGKAGAVLYRFISTGSAFKMSIGWKAPRSSFSCAKAQLAAGDFTRDGKDDAIVLYKSTTTSSRLYVFVAGASKFTKKTFWSGKYAAGRAQLAAGDVDSDGDFDAICLYRKPDNTGRLDVFLSSGSAFTGPTPWYDGSALPGSGCRFVVDDVTGDGRADGLIARSAGSSSSLVACVSAGSAFVPATWWTGPWRYAGLRLGCAPSPGLVISDHAQVVDAATLDALSGVAADGTLTFDQETTQLQQLELGDVLISQPDAANPQGIFRKVSSVSESGGSVIVTTTQAALDDVVQFGEVGFVKRVRPGDLSQADVTQPGVRLTSKRGDPLITFAISTELKVPVGDHTETAVKLDGSISLDPVAYFSYNVGWTGLKSLSYTQVMNATSDLDVEVTETLSAKLEKTLLEAPLGTIAVVVPPGVPIWVTPVFKLYVGAGGSVSAGVTAGVTETVTSTVTLGYWSGSFHAPTFSSSRDTTWRKPKLFGELTLEAYAGAGLEFLLYSIAGPYASIEAGLILEAVTNRTRWWELSANVDFEIGVTLDLRLAELTASYPFNLFKYPIDWARTPYGQRGVSGKVTAADSGAPLAGATVKLLEGAGSFPWGIVWGTTTTAADGTYSFAAPPVGDYTVTAAKSGYLSGWGDTTVVANVVTEGQDIALSPGSLPGGGVSGVVRNAATNAPLAGASVEVRQGADNPFGPLLATTTSTANGSYEFWDIPVGKCTVVARKTGFDANSRTAQVDSGAWTVGHDILLTPAGQFASMRSALDGYIRWARAFDDQANATFEFWFRPTEAGGMEYGNDIAQISRDYTDWMGDGPARWPIMQIQFSGSPSAPTLDFWINENVGDESGAIHRLTSTSQLQLGLWYHIAVQYGSQGMKLFVNGHLEASNTYTKRAEANQGAAAGGWFSLGDNHTVGSGYMSALGDYRGLRVSNVERYPNDFLPQDLPREDGYTRIHDPLAGATNGENVNFVPTP